MQDVDKSNAPVTLVIGDMVRWKHDSRALPDVRDLHFLDAAEVSAEAIEAVGPEIILSPLVVRDIDAIEIARALSQLGFAGRYRVLSSALPDPASIEAEVRAVAPQIDFGVLNLTREADDVTAAQP